MLRSATIRTTPLALASAYGPGFAKPARPADRWAIAAVLFYLALIISIGKGPTYIGYPPIFLGELVLGAGLVALLCGHRLSWVLTGEPALTSTLILAFMLVGAVITAYTVPRWGVDALRDAAVWYYAAFFFIGKKWGAEEAAGATVWKWMPLFWVIALVWGSINALTADALILASPVVSWRNLPVLS